MGIEEAVVEADVGVGRLPGLGGVGRAQEGNEADFVAKRERSGDVEARLDINAIGERDAGATIGLDVEL